MILGQFSQMCFNYEAVICVVYLDESLKNHILGQNTHSCVMNGLPIYQWNISWVLFFSVVRNSQDSASSHSMLLPLYSDPVGPAVHGHSEKQKNNNKKKTCWSEHMR